MSVYFVVSTVLSLELIYNKCYLCHQYFYYFFFFKIHSCVTFWLVLAYFIHSLQSSGSKYLLELIWEILDISLILWVFSLFIYIYMIFFSHIWCDKVGGSSQPRDWTRFSCIAGRFFTILATRKTLISYVVLNLLLCLFFFFSSNLTR